MYNEISIIIGHDEYVDGEISQSEIFIKQAYERGTVVMIIGGTYADIFEKFVKRSFLRGNFGYDFCCSI